MTKTKITTDKSITPIINATVKMLQESNGTDKLINVDGCTGLFLRVYVTGKNAWLYRYKKAHATSQTKITLGEYPAVSLANAREKQFTYDNLRKQGIDPQSWQQEKDSENARLAKSTFATISREWLDRTYTPNTETHSKHLEKINTLNGYFGKKSVNDIETQEIAHALKDLQAKKRQIKDPSKPSDYAHRCYTHLREIFKYAYAQGLCRQNPVKTELKTVLEPYKYGERPALIEPLAFGKLLADIEKHKDEMELATYRNLKLLAYLAVRNCDIRFMKWADIDFKKAIWKFKPIKGQSDSKIKMVENFEVPLSKQVLAILTAQHTLTGNHRYVFFSQQATVNQVISENTTGQQLKKLGYQDIHCPHGFRSTAKTLLMQELGYDDMLTEMVLGHIVGAGNPYLRADLFNDRRALMQTWADYIDDLQTGKATTHYKAIYRTSTHELLQQLIKMQGTDKIKQMIDMIDNQQA